MEERDALLTKIRSEVDEEEIFLEGMVWDYHTHRKVGPNKVMFGDEELHGELSLMVSTFRTGTCICQIDYSHC